MLKTLEVFTDGITTPPFGIVDQPASLDSIQIKNIDGLGPVTATVNTTQYGSIDGEFLNGVSTPKRNIVMTVRLRPSWSTQSIESLRQALYSYFMPEQTVRLRFSSTHMPTVEIVGVVESCEPNMFDKDAEYQISIICPDPYFYAVDSTVLTGTTLALTDTGSVVIPYQGSVPTGFLMDISLPSGGSTFNGDIRLLNNGINIQLLIATAVQISATQSLDISTIEGNKYARYIPLPSGQYTNVLNKVSPGSNWFPLTRGTNRLQVLSTVAGLNWTLTYSALYGGL